MYAYIYIYIYIHIYIYIYIYIYNYNRQIKLTLVATTSFMFSQSSGLHSIRFYCYRYTFMIHFEINKLWEKLKHLDFNCFIANQFEMDHRFFKMYLFLW